MRPATGQFHHFDPFQLDLAFTKMLKQTRSTAKQDGHDIHLEFIGETRSQALLRRVRRADDVDILLSCRLFRLTDRTFLTVRDEGKSQLLRLFWMLLWGMMGKDKDRHLILVIACKPIRVF